MGEAMSIAGNHSIIGVGPTAAPRRNSVALYCYTIVNEAGKQVVFTA